MNCHICHDQGDPAELHSVHLGQETVLVCADCIAVAVGGLLADRDQWASGFCKGCPQLTKDGCLQGVTPQTCA